MISKELLSEVLGLHIHHCKKVAQSSIIRYKFDAIGEVRDSSINIYELAHKCKEWAYNEQNYIVKSYFDYEWIVIIGDNMINFSANTEPEAIFKACQFILEKGLK